MVDPIETLMRAICVAYARIEGSDEDDFWVSCAPSVSDAAPTPVKPWSAWVGAVGTICVFPAEGVGEATGPTLLDALRELARQVEAKITAQHAETLDAIVALRRAQHEVVRDG